LGSRAHFVGAGFVVTDQVTLAFAWPLEMTIVPQPAQLHVNEYKGTQHDGPLTGVSLALGQNITYVLKDMLIWFRL
jgi:hypothetical protein